MIIFVRGLVAQTAQGCVDIDVHGIGYRLWVPDKTALQVQLGSEVTLHTYHYIREDTQELYGFLTEAEREWFTLLLGVSGIGPKVALQIISAAEYQQFAAAVQSEDSRYLCQLPGIGKKTAQRLLLDLKDKIEALWTPAADVSMPTTSSSGNETTQTLRVDLVEALKSLGYNERQAVTTVTGVLSQAEDWTLETALTRCLQQIDLRNAYD